MANKAISAAFSVVPIIILSHYIISKFFIIVKRPIGFTWFQEEGSKRKKKGRGSWGDCGRAAIGIGIGNEVKGCGDGDEENNLTFGDTIGHLTSTL